MLRWPCASRIAAGHGGDRNGETAMEEAAMEEAAMEEAAVVTWHASSAEHASHARGENEGTLDGRRKGRHAR